MVEACAATLVCVTGAVCEPPHPERHINNTPSDANHRKLARCRLSAKKTIAPMSIPTNAIHTELAKPAVLVPAVVVITASTLYVPGGVLAFVVTVRMLDATLNEQFAPVGRL